ncbi:MAG: hypothetical protein IT548_00025 [Alphaproteobacteria bacterium]|nr:hypothetical protein [Alphaproteobacteria bacterium]
MRRPFSRFVSRDQERDAPPGPATGGPVHLALGSDPLITIAPAQDTDENNPSQLPGNPVFTIGLSEASTETVTVKYRILLAGTAVGSDLGNFSNFPSNETITFTPGQTSKTITIGIAADAFDERDEHFVIELFNPVNGHFEAFYPTIRASAVIWDDEPPADNSLAYFVSDPVIVEGDAGQHLAQFEIRLSKPPGPAGLAFNYTTRDGSATAGTDYVAQSGTVTFTAGQEFATVSINVIGDAVREHSESFFLAVTPATAVDIGTDGATGEAQILDDDAASGPVISLIRAPTIQEDQVLDGQAFQITLSEASATPITVSYRVLLAGTAVETDLSGSGFDNTSGGVNNTKTVTFAAGETSKTIIINRIEGDNVSPVDEIDRHVTMELYNPLGASFAGGVTVLTASAVIQDNDGPGPNLAFFVSDPIVTEGDSGTTTALFEIRLSRPATSEMVFAWTTATGTATAGSDFISANNTVTFVPGQEVAFVQVTVNGDTTPEQAESFRLIVTPPAGSGLSTIDAVAEATILADDYILPSVTLLAVPGTDELRGSVRWTVTLSEASATPVTIAYRTLFDGTARDDDLAGGSNPYDGTLTFAAGETSKTITIRSASGDTDEHDEKLTLELYNPNGAEFGSGAPLLRSAGVILDTALTVSNPAIFVSDPVLLEGDAGTRFAVFEVRLSRPVDTQTVIAYATADGSAVAGSDYIAAGGNIVFAPGQDAATVTVQVMGDTASETSESFSLFVTPPGGFGYSLLEAAGEATLIDDDSVPPTLTITPIASLSENFGTMRFTVTLSKPAATAVTVQYATTYGTATAGDIATALSGTITIPAGQNSAHFQLSYDDDPSAEFDETLFVTFSNPANAVFAGGAANFVATGIVRDNDGPQIDAVLLAPAPITVKETVGAFTPVEIVLRLSRPSESALTFAVGAAGTAIAGSDYTLVDATLAFAPGQTTASVTLNIRSDVINEVTENLTLSFTPSGGTAIDAPLPAVTVTIEDGPGTSGDDIIQGSPAVDGIAGFGGNDAITGLGGADTLMGDAGNDTLDGGGGVDTLIGGAGNDTYVNPAGDTITEAAGGAGGTDTVQSDATITLAANVERLFLTGTAAANGTGNALANQINGNTANNVLAGLGGNDTLAGAAGGDTLNGGLGADVLTGGTQRDKLVPGNDSDADRLVFAILNDSTGVTRDVIAGLDLNGEDRIDLPAIPVAIAAAVNGGALNTATFNADLAAALPAAALPAGRAVLFNPTSGNQDLANTVYLVVDANGVAGYQANQDWVFQLENPTGTLTVDDFV